MILPSVGYRRPDSVAAAVEALAGDPDAVVLAGGQTLLNVLKLRLARPSALVDIGRLQELRRIEATGDALRIGAAATYDEIAASADVRSLAPHLAAVADGLVDRQVRARGTIGGNLCLNDPGSNYPPVAVALGASMCLTGPDGRRTVPAEQFFLGPFAVDLRVGELLESVEFPVLGAGQGFGYAALQLGRDSWALARAAVLIRAGAVIEDARVVVSCTSPSPARQPAVEEALRGVGSDAGAASGRERATAAAGEGVEAPSDIHASGEYRIEMLRVMVQRAVEQALQERNDG